MRRALGIWLAAALLLAAAPAPVRAAGLGVEEFDVALNGPLGEAVTQAGSHPFSMTTKIVFDSTPTAEGGKELQAAAKDFWATQMPGFVGNPTAVPSCPATGFLTKQQGLGGQVPNCPDATAVGTVAINLAGPTSSGTTYSTVYNLTPPPGVPSKLGFIAVNAPVTIEVGVEESPPYNLIAAATNISQVVEVVSATLTLWGVPADPAHDDLRGRCFSSGGKSLGQCPANVSPVPFLTLPRACTGPLRTTYAVDSWEDPGARLANGRPDPLDSAWVTGFAETHGEGGLPAGMSGCGKLGFGPEVRATPTTASAESSSGLEIEINVEDEGIANPEGISQADIEALELRLPAGVTANPSAAEGQGVCTEAQFKAASLTVSGCPDAAKLGSLEVDTPILENHTLKGSFYLAEPYANPFGSLLAAYLVIRDAELGVFVKLPAQITTDEATGQLVTRVQNMPPFPLEHVKVRLRSGPRAPLITPPACGTYASEAILTPSSGAAPLHSTSSFQLTSGPAGGPCPLALPFSPGFSAGAQNSTAGRYSPFSMRITRQDGEQDITRFSATLPPGEVARIAGVPQCPDAAIEAAKKKKLGREELVSPSCPAASEIGTVVGGAGVGTALTYVTGSLYLAGPYHGDQLSVVAIVPAVAGPFDVGTVITRVALALNPETGEAEVDGAASDPIPHILKGIPLKLRDLRVYANRPDFTLNPTSCSVLSTRTQIFGSGADPFNPADDTSASPSSRYQASSCVSLAFKPSLKLTLKGGTRRNDHPALHSVVTYPKGSGYANIGRAVVILPHSEFIDPERIGNPCTRVQFAAGACPKESILGYAKAYTPLLDQPLQGRVYFRSNGGARKVPDIVADLNGQFHVVLVGAVDSVDPKNAKIRTTFAGVPDAPVSRFTLNLKGGSEGVLVNSASLCAVKRYAQITLRAQNGRQRDFRAPLRVKCPKR